jgi:hypothetical protein
MEGCNVRQFRNSALAALAALAAKLDAVMALDFNTLHATSSLDAIYDTNFPGGLDPRNPHRRAGRRRQRRGRHAPRLDHAPGDAVGGRGGTGSKAKSGTWSWTGARLARRHLPPQERRRHEARRGHRHGDGRRRRHDAR